MRLAIALVYPAKGRGWSEHYGAEWRVLAWHRHIGNTDVVVTRA